MEGKTAVAVPLYVQSSGKFRNEINKDRDTARLTKLFAESRAPAVPCLGEEARPA